MTDEPIITTETVPCSPWVSALVEAAEAEREAALSMLTPETRALVEAIEQEADRRALFGEQA